jgi:hypothetical protein
MQETATRRKISLAFASHQSVALANLSAPFPWAVRNFGVSGLNSKVFPRFLVANPTRWSGLIVMHDRFEALGMVVQIQR